VRKEGGELSEVDGGVWEWGGVEKRGVEGRVGMGERGEKREERRGS